jgi:hypothetical protein
MPQPLSLGNHRLSSDGFRCVTNMGIATYAFVSGTELVLQHSQHGIAVEKIPKGHFAILAPQKGRNWGFGFD